MKNYLVILLLPLLTFCGEQKKEDPESLQVQEEGKTEPQKVQQATYYLIRHAEKEVKDPKNQDPGLNIEGMIRSNAWADYFGPIRIDEIYHTRYIRTKQTISLTAQRKAIAPIRYEPNTIYSEEFLNKTNGKTVLIVGHSNTIPKLVNQLIGQEKYKDMDDTDHSTLFKVTIDGRDKKAEVIKVEVEK